jgi:hypothetical protein
MADVISRPWHRRAVPRRHDGRSGDRRLWRMRGTHCARHAHWCVRAWAVETA